MEAFDPRHALHELSSSLGQVLRTSVVAFPPPWETSQEDLYREFTVLYRGRRRLDESVERMKVMRENYDLLLNFPEVPSLVRRCKMVSEELDRDMRTNDSPFEEPDTARSKMMSRFDDGSKGRAKLAEMISLLERLNSKLEAAVPRRSAQLILFEGEGPELERRKSNSDEDASARSSGTAGTIHQAPKAPSDTSSAPAAECRRQDLCSLWEMCLSTAKSMVLFARQDPAVFENLHERLRIWGSGLFSGSMDLDSLILQDQQLRRKLAKPMISLLVHLALEQERMINAWSITHSDCGHRELKHTAFALRHFLAMNDTTKAAFADRATSDDRCDTDSDANETSDAAASYLTALTDLLFEYLPAINRVRRSQVLKDEACNSRERRASIDHDEGRRESSRERRDVRQSGERAHSFGARPDPFDSSSEHDELRPSRRRDSFRRDFRF